MSRIKSKDTKPELKVRRYLFSRGFRYRINFDLFGNPDVVFPANKIAIFVHGCFWHQHGCSNTYRPKTNKKFWNNKLDRNIQRDKDVMEKLAQQDWEIYYLWECNINQNLESTIKPLINKLKMCS